MAVRDTTSTTRLGATYPERVLVCTWLLAGWYLSLWLFQDRSLGVQLSHGALSRVPAITHVEFVDWAFTQSPRRTPWPISDCTAAGRTHRLLLPELRVGSGRPVGFSA